MTTNKTKKYYCPHCGHYMENEQLSHCSYCGVEYKNLDTPCEQEYEIGDEVRFNNKKYRIKDVRILIPEGGFLYEDMYLLQGCEDFGYLNSYLLYKK